MKQPAMRCTSNPAYREEETMYVNRDCFARIELHKFPAAKGSTCTWCGSIGRKAPVCVYETQSDGGSKAREFRPFCNLSCRASFYGHD